MWKSGLAAATHIVVPCKRVSLDLSRGNETVSAKLRPEMPTSVSFPTPTVGSPQGICMQEWDVLHIVQNPAVMFDWTIIVDPTLEW